MAFMAEGTTRRLSLALSATPGRINVASIGMSASRPAEGSPRTVATPLPTATRQTIPTVAFSAPTATQHTVFVWPTTQSTVAAVHSVTPTFALRPTDQRAVQRATSTSAETIIANLALTIMSTRPDATPTRQPAVNVQRAATEQAATATRTASIPTRVAVLPSLEQLLQPPQLLAARVLEVIDGATIDVTIGREQQRIRLAGIQVPSAGGENGIADCGGRAAFVRVYQLLRGRPIALEREPLQGKRDKYGRWTYWVWITGSWREDGELLNVQLVKDGLARTLDERAYVYSNYTSSAEQEALVASRGVWSSETCAGDFNRPEG